MINDVEAVGTTRGDFTEFMKKRDRQPGAVKLPYSIDVTVLTRAHWPVFKLETLTVPRVLQESLDLFKTYYDAKNSARKLQWLHVHSTGTMTRTFQSGDKQYEISLSTAQMCVCLLFNTQERVRVSDMAALGVPVDEIRKYVFSLACGKFPILKAGEGKKKIEATDEIEVNEAFKDPHTRIKIAMVQAKETGETVIETTTKARVFLMEAAIVRIMKSRQTLNHTDLSTECIKQLSSLFGPDPKQIKKVIEDLITREYLRRDPGKRDQFHYVA
eukprot:NODE_249_length_1052_cov_187.340151_g246_i0.p1 GENE.NODE_249_length_1052_cov_187.340151_g246_i0~~NODE_249_length_1052_cov_187.340151_g246_i0.p1  ORF type:complete len:308 (-),score=63.79 NODE_249_length_1052_cov_187.340151_g246_i0:127-942(-)